MTKSQHWQERVGSQRDWVWRGWQTRYTYFRSLQGNENSPPLLFLHGFGASIEHWRHNLPILRKDHTVYALDFLGFGASRKVTTSYSIDLWVEQVYEFWQTFIRHPVVLVGNSIGSLVALATATAHPDMVQGLVMLNLPDIAALRGSSPKWVQSVATTAESILASPPLLKTLFKIIRRPGVVRLWAGLAYVDKSAIADELIDILCTPAQDEGATLAFCALCQAKNNPSFAPSVSELLPHLTIPMLLIWGRQDRMIPFALADQFLKLNPNINFVDLAQAGHCPHDECPEEFNTILLDWLQKSLVKGVEPFSLSTQP